MGRNIGQHNVYIPEEEWRLLCEAKKRTGVSVSKQLILAYCYWIKNNPKALQDLAERFERISEVKEAKEQERKTGDFLGSFEKMKEKIARIKRRVKNGDITEELGKILIQQTKNHYETTQRAYEEDILKNEKPKKKKHSATLVYLSNNNTLPDLRKKYTYIPILL